MQGRAVENSVETVQNLDIALIFPKERNRNIHSWCIKDYAIKDLRRCVAKFEIWPVPLDSLCQRTSPAYLSLFSHNNERETAWEGRIP